MNQFLNKSIYSWLFGDAYEICVKYMKYDKILWKITNLCVNRRLITYLTPCYAILGHPWLSTKNFNLTLSIYIRCLLKHTLTYHHIVIERSIDRRGYNLSHHYPAMPDLVIQKCTLLSANTTSSTIIKGDRLFLNEDHQLNYNVNTEELMKINLPKE